MGWLNVKFVICAPRYEPESGGSIVLYKLARVLHTLGHEVRIWPIHRIRRERESLARHTLRRAAYVVTRSYRPRFAPHPDLRGALAVSDDLADSVVIYPDIVAGNPLGAARYVRWLLFRPGELGVPFQFSQGDLYFCFQEAFNVHCEGMRYGGALTVLDWMTDIYRQTQFGHREGVCYMLRKGAKRTDLPSLRGLEVVDRCRHRQLADIFNSRRVCYFFDPYTAYSEYAALCGCIPVVVPIPGMSRQAWTPPSGDRLGVAYGEDDIARALASRDRLGENIAASQVAGVDSALRFISVVGNHFGSFDVKR